MLASVLKPEMVLLQAQVADWEDAVRKGGALLIQGGCISEAYVEAMVNAVREYGPYIVIAPQIAIPHAKAEEGVLAAGISILSLARPVNFGNEANDPVRYVFCLASGNPATHLALMRSFVSILEDKAFFELLDSPALPEDVINYVLKFESEGR